MKNRIYVDLHVLQTVPPSCINRDDTGSPKTAVYGGVTRARVSSQSWKKAVRDLFKDELFSESDLGVRTKRIVKMIAAEIEAQGGTDSEKLAIKVLADAGLKLKEDKNKEAETGALFFLSSAQGKALAALAIRGGADKKEAKAALTQQPGIDIALFGRMVADDPSLNTDASAQVAHSISTHKVSNEFDYFTAVDDMSPEDNAGAGMIGTVEYNSSTLYRYATVAVHELAGALGEDTVRAVTGFTDAFIRSMPTGKQNTFANRTLPYAVVATVRTDQPINLVGAFEKPIGAGSGGYEEGSAAAFVAHAQKVYADWLSEPAKAYAVGEGVSALGEKVSLDGLLKGLSEELEKQVAALEAAK
jgi:CRISPR system Cascade subunit CasC